MTALEGFEDTALHEAVRYSDVEDVKTALRSGCDPNQIGWYQWTPLHEAANNGDLCIVKLLLSFKADVDKKDWLKGSTAVHYAARAGHYQVLKLLVDCGGRYDVSNNEGKTPLDVATGPCSSLLKGLILGKAVSSDVRPQEIADHEEKSPSENHDEQLVDTTYLEADDISILSDSSTGSWPSRRAWEEGSSVNINKKPDLGHIELSFEYNSKNGTLKIRVWQIADLLFPPADTSTINSVCVKSYLMPDEKRDSKRKSEDLQVYTKADVSNTKNNSSQNSFKSRTFRFTKGLEYKKITKKIVEERIVHIEVCVTQKYTRRSFTIGTWNSPLNSAVKQLVKTKYPLTPRLSTELPSSMKVYGANLHHMSQVNYAYSSSVPNSRTHSMSSLPNTSNERASSDSDLQAVKVEPIKTVPSIEITVPSEDEDEIELQNTLHQVHVVESMETKLGSTPVNIAQQWNDSVDSLPGMIELQELEDVIIDQKCRGTTDAIIHVPNDPEWNKVPGNNNVQALEKKEKSISKKSKRFSFSRNIANDSKEGNRKIKKTDADEKSGKRKLSIKSKSRSDDCCGTGDTRAESPVGDSLAEPLRMIPIEFELHELADSSTADPTSVQLPIETRLEMLPRVHGSRDMDQYKAADRDNKSKATRRSSAGASSRRKAKAIIQEV